MTDLLHAANRVVESCLRKNLPVAVIGGLALQFRGQDRLTRDVDLSLLAGWGDMEPLITELVAEFRSRHSDPVSFGTANRIVLLEVDGVAVDVALAAFEFEETIIRGSEWIQVTDSIRLPVVTAEALVTMKAFASREQDWVDIEGIIERQGRQFGWHQVLADLDALMELSGDYTIRARLEKLRKRFP